MNINIKELKKELSKVAGINFFSPEYRDIFKRHLGGDKTAEGDETAETDKADLGEAENSDDTNSGGESQSQEQSADNSDDSSNDSDNSDGTDGTDNSDESDEQDSDVDDSQRDEEDSDTLDDDSQTESAEEKALQRLLGDDGDGDSETDVSGEQYNSDSDEDEGGETGVQTEDEAAAEGSGDVTTELLNTKLELELVRAGIREDRLETAKRLFMPEFKQSGGNAEQIRELIAQYPEWLGSKGGAQGFGMPLGDKADALTNEEKALKRMGIDPRD